LQKHVSPPNQPTHQANLVANLKKLYDALENSSFNRLTPSTKQIIAEVTEEMLLGEDLKLRIEQIFAKYSITPVNALEEISS